MRRIPLALALLALLAAPSARATDVIVSHVGRLFMTGNSGDEPVNGLRKLKFALHRKSVDASGEDNLVWEQEYADVEVNNGFYKVELGDTAGGRAPLDLDDLVGAPALWLEVSVYDAGGASAVKLSPRLRMTPSYAASHAGNADRLGGLLPEEYLKRGDFEAFKTEFTGGGEGGLSVPWARVAGVPSDFADGVDDGLRQVAVAGTALTGTGTGEDGLRVKEGGIETAHLKDGAVTAQKLAPGAVTPDVFEDGSVSPEKLTTCPEGQILKMQSGKWQCGFDTGSGGTLTFDVLAPIEQVPGSNGNPAKVQLKDGGIETVKLANDAVDASKLKAEDAALGKITGNAIVSKAGAIGIGVTSPLARLETTHYPTAGTTGTGSVTYAANALTATLSGGTFPSQAAVGDLIQFGNLGWRTITSVAATTVGIDAGYTSGFSGTFSLRRATMHLANLHQTGLGNVGIGTAAPQAPLHVAGAMILETSSPAIYTGTGTSELNRYLSLLNSPGNASASGLKAGGLLVADTYSYANPGKNDAVIKGSLRVDGPLNGACLARKMRYEATCLAHGIKAGYANVATVSAKTFGSAASVTGTALCNSYVGNNSITGWTCLAMPYVYDSAASGNQSGADVRPTWSTCATTFPYANGDYPWFDENACTGVMMACCGKN